MKAVFEYIETKSAAFAERPLFSFLRDAGIEPQKRLAFVPFMAHFVMTFADLYNFVLPVNPPGDRFQELVNIHVREDAGHWKWFLADLSNADLDPTLHFTEALKFVWSSATTKTRMLSYEICKLNASVNSLERLVMVQCIEATGGVGLAALAAAGSDFAKGTERKLVYFGSHHVETESDHTLEAPSVRASLEDLVLTDAARSKSCAIVDLVFERFDDSVDEMYRAASARLVSGE